MSAVRRSGAGDPDTPVPEAVGRERTRLFALSEDECLRLISPGGVGRVAFSGRSGLMVLPVNYAVRGGVIVFRTAIGGVMDEELDTGLEGVEYKVAFEVDHIDEASRRGWDVLIQGPLHHVVGEEELAGVADIELDPWAGGERHRYLKITPTRITGRRVGNGGDIVEGDRG